MAGSGCEDSDEKREHWFISNLLNRIEYVVIKRRKTKNFWMSYMVISLENPKTFGCFFWNDMDEQAFGYEYHD